MCPNSHWWQLTRMITTAANGRHRRYSLHHNSRYHYHRRYRRHLNRPI